MFKNVAIVGAAGNLGPFIVKALLDRKFNVTIIARQDSTSNFPSAAKVAKGDFTAGFLDGVLSGQDAVIITLGGNAEKVVKATVEAAVRVGVKRIVPGEFGSDIVDSPIVANVAAWQAKEALMSHLKKVTAGSEVTSWTAIINGPFFDWCLKRGVFGFNLKDHTAIIYDKGTTKVDATTLSTVGAATAQLLMHSDKYANEHIWISSFTVSQNDILAALKAATTDDWTLKDATTAEKIKSGMERFKQGDPYGDYDALFGSMFQPGNKQDFSNYRKLSNKDLGLEPENFEQVVRETLTTDRDTIKW